MVHSAEVGSIPVPDMSALIARLEAAEAGSREFDRELMALTYRREKRYIGASCWDDEIDTCCPGAKHLDWVWVDPGDDKWSTTARDGLEFTTSLDAALALADRVLPGWVCQIDIQSDLSWVLAAPDWWTPALAQGPEARGGQSSVAKTPALALCIAILKAKAQGEGG